MTPKLCCHCSWPIFNVLLDPVQRLHFGHASCQWMLGGGALLVYQELTEFFPKWKKGVLVDFVGYIQVIKVSEHQLLATWNLQIPHSKVGLKLATLQLEKPDGLVVTMANAVLSRVLQFYQVYKRDAKMERVLSLEIMLLCNHWERITGVGDLCRILKYEAHSANFVRCKTILRLNELPYSLLKWASRLFLFLSILSICSFGFLFLTHLDTLNYLNYICCHSLCGHYWFYFKGAKAKTNAN